MKLLKNIIQLLVLTSLGLSVTPLTTAQAATTNKAIQVDTTSAKTSALDISLQRNNSIDTATPASASATPTDGSTTTGKEATSNVSVTVLSGILTLEAVPDFNFGTMMQGSTGKLKSNTVDTSGYDGNNQDPDLNTAGIDGNSQGLLEVIDSRNELKNMPGFDLTASMGPLKTEDSDTDTADIDAILNLNPSPLVDGDNNNVSNSSKDLSTEKVAINSKSKNNPSVMNLQPNTYNAGVISTKFNTPDSASLELPGSGNGNIKSSKRMNAVITWTLTAKPTVTTD